MGLWGSIGGNAGRNKSLELKDIWVPESIVMWLNMDFSAELSAPKIENIGLDTQCWSSVCLNMAKRSARVQCRQVTSQNIDWGLLYCSKAGRWGIHMLTMLPGIFLLPSQKKKCCPRAKKQVYYFTDQSTNVDVPISSVFHPLFAKTNTNLGKGRYFMKLCGLT